MSSSTPIFDQLLNTARDKSLPPVDQWHPERVGDIDIRIDASGRWFHEGVEIKRAPLINLFSTILRKDDDGYCLVTPAEKQRITVDDVPFVVIDFETKGQGDRMDLLVTTNVGDSVLVSEQHPLQMRNDIPYVQIRGGLQARFNRATYYRLIELADSLSSPSANDLTLTLNGARFIIGSRV